MARFSILICTVLFLHCINCEPVMPNNNAVVNFIYAVLEDFRSGLEDEELDPILIEEPHTVDISGGIAEIDGEFTEIIATGLKNFNAHVDFDLSSFSLRLLLECEYTLSGHYNLTGLILSTYPVNGVGQWQMRINELELHSNTNFRIVDGFVVLDPFHQYFDDVWNGVVTSFPGFIEENDFGGIGQNVLLELRDEIRSSPLRKAIQLIFNGTSDIFHTRFSEMSLIDIIGNYTNPPSTTTTTTRRPTEDPGTPCPLVVIHPEDNSNDVQILSEEVEMHDHEIIVTTVYKRVSKIPRA